MVPQLMYLIVRRTLFAPEAKFCLACLPFIWINYCVNVAFSLYGELLKSKLHYEQVLYVYIRFRMASLLLAAFRELQFNNFHWDFFFFLRAVPGRRARKGSAAEGRLTGCATKQSLSGTSGA